MKSALTLLAITLLPFVTQVSQLNASDSTTSEELKTVAGMSLEDLLNVKVTSASQKEQKLSDVAAAMTVINADDIRRSGATNIPDLLRYVPGVQVAAANNNATSVGIRDFGGIFASKLLVLVDGRSIYDPFFSGVDWQSQKIMMENIERVEVIRGPGATVWGANAVNGVINIITKDAKDAQGGLIGATYGTKEQGTGEFRYGFQPAKDLAVYAYGEYHNEDASKPITSIGRYDDCQDYLGGVRADYKPSSEDHFRLSSDVSSTRSGDEQFFNGNPITPAYHENTDRENVNFVFEHNVETDNVITLQSYYDRFAQSTIPTAQLVTEEAQTADFQIRQSLPIDILPIKQELIYGAEYREVSSHLGGPGLVETNPSRRNDQTFSLFAQSDLHLIDDVLTLTLGSKYDHNDYTGNEVQPSARILWKIDKQNSVWASVSRAVREPSIVEANAVSGGSVLGNQNLKSEELTAYEMGYRVEPIKELSIDIAAYYNSYDNLIETFSLSGLSLPIREQYQKANVFGIEPSFKAQLQPWWRLSGSYSLSKMNIDNSGIPSGTLSTGASLDSVDPKNEFSLRSSFDLPNNIDFDLGGRFVDKVSGANGYFVMDTRLGWRPTSQWELSIVGQNLFMANHIEFPGQFGNTTYVTPEVYGKVVFKF